MVSNFNMLNLSDMMMIDDDDGIYNSFHYVNVSVLIKFSEKTSVFT